jgi:transcriptional regulator with XRE-family HTH domain
MRDPLDVFSTNLKRLRLQRGWSQERMALQSSLNPSHLPKIEHSEREPAEVLAFVPDPRDRALLLGARRFVCDRGAFAAVELEF